MEALSVPRMARTPENKKTFVPVLGRKPKCFVVPPNFGAAGLRPLPFRMAGKTPCSRGVLGYNLTSGAYSRGAILCRCAIPYASPVNAKVSLFFLRVDYITPIQITALEALNQDLSGGYVRCEWDVVLVAEPGDFIYVCENIALIGVAEKQYQVNLVVGYSRAYLLISTLLAGQVEVYGQTSGLGNKFAGCVSRTDRVAG